MSKYKRSSKELYYDSGTKFQNLLIESRGFNWENNNCFLDSILFALFVYRLSPFYLMPCENEFCLLIKQVMCDLVVDKHPDSTCFRTELSGNIQGQTQEDASEALTIILHKLDFNPSLILIQKNDVFYNSKTNESIAKEDKFETSDLITVHVSDVKNGGDPIKNYLETTIKKTPENMDKFTQLKDTDFFFDKKYTFNQILKADCLIFNVIRYRASDLDERKKLKQSITTPENIIIDNVCYFRCAVVCHEGKNMKSGHYKTYIWNGEYDNDAKYYVEDDTNNKKLKHNQIKKQEFDNQIKKNGVIFFYYIWY